MNAPVREPDSDGPSKDGPSSYAPKRARRSDQNPKVHFAPDKVAAPHQPVPEQPEPPEPPWKHKKQRQAFAGDIAAAELRSRLALAPDRLPDPPPHSAAAPRFTLVGRLAGVIVVATVGVVGYRWGSAPHATSPQGLLALFSKQTNNQAPVSATDVKTRGLDSKAPAARVAGGDPAPV